MNSWQDLTDYVYSEIEHIAYFKNNKPNINNILALANESLMSLTVDYISVDNVNVLENVGIIDYPNNLTEIFRIELNGEEVERVNSYEFNAECPELHYKTGDYKIIFNHNINAGEGELVIIGKGKFDMYTKDPNDDRVFNLLPIEFHYLPAYFILQKLYVRAKDFNAAQYYMQMYQQMVSDYHWTMTKRRCKPATFMPTYYEKKEDNRSWEIYDKVTVEITSTPSLTPAQIHNEINSAVNNLASTLYTKQEVDAKDTATLNNAKDYTYSKQAITNKDNGILQQAKNYTDEQVGAIGYAIDEMIGDDE